MRPPWIRLRRYAVTGCLSSLAAPTDFVATRISVVAFSLFCSAAAPLSAGAQTVPPTAPGIQEVVSKASDAVVQIRAFDGAGRPIAVGSGFILPDGRILTNAQVLRDAARVDVFSVAAAMLLSSTFAEVIHPSLNVAVLPRISGAKSTLTLSLVTPSVGEQVVAIGSPEGFANTVSEGTVSAMRTVAGRSLVQVTAASSARNPGGPTLNRSGEVIGMTVAIAVDGQNLTFAIPAADIRAVLNNPAGKVSFALATPPTAISAAPSVPSTAPGTAPGTAPSNAAPNAPASAPVNAPASVPPNAPVSPPARAPSSAPAGAPANAPANAPTSADEAVRAAQSYLAAGQNAAAETVARGAIATYPGSAELHLVLGQIHSKNKRSAEAITYHRQAISLKPTLHGPYAGIAEAYADLGLADSVIATIRVGLSNGEDKGSLANAAMKMGTQLYQSGSASKSRPSLQMAVQVLLLSDQLRPSSDAKFLAGAASFLIGQSAIAEAHVTLSCPTTTLAQEALAVAMQNVPAGQDAYPDAAKQILSAIAQFSVAASDMAKRVCK